MNQTVADDPTGLYPAVDLSYAANPRIIGPGPVALKFPGVDLSFINEPSQKIDVMESVYNADPDYNAQIGYETWDTTDEFETAIYAGHIKQMNCLFVDGHVKSMLPSNTMTPFNMWGGFTTQSADGYDCNIQSVNCDVPSASVASSLASAENQY